MFNQEAFYDFILSNDIVRIFDTPITLKSGQTSHLYINWRNITNDVIRLEQCAHFVIAFCQEKNLSPDCFYGVPEGATKLGIITQYLWAKENHASAGTHQLCMGRATPKIHGDPADKFFIGEPQGSIILLEDVTTTGASMLKTLEQLHTLNKNVIACIGLTNREPKTLEQSIQEQTQKFNVPYFNLAKAHQILENLAPTLPEHQKTHIKNEQERLS